MATSAGTSPWIPRIPVWEGRKQWLRLLTNHSACNKQTGECACVWRPGVSSLIGCWSCGLIYNKGVFTTVRRGLIHWGLLFLTFCARDVSFLLCTLSFNNQKIYLPILQILGERESPKVRTTNLNKKTMNDVHREVTNMDAACTKVKQKWVFPHIGLPKG